jgi:hypothetical protein
MTPGLGVSIGVTAIVVIVVAFAFVAAGVVDAIRLDTAAWEASGQPKVIWVLFMAIGFVACGLIGIFATVLYFVSIRPRVTRSIT